MENLVKVAKSIIYTASLENLNLRLFGSLGILLHCETSYFDQYRKIPRDIDLVGKMNDILKIHRFFRDFGFQLVQSPHPYKDGKCEHREYLGQYNGKDYQVDLFIGSLIFNHYIPLPYIDSFNKYTLPVTQLLLSKLSIVELKINDEYDICNILLNHKYGNDNKGEEILENFLRVLFGQGRCGWCLTLTCINNILRIKKNITAYNLTISVKERLSNQIDTLEHIISTSNKTFTWKLKNRYGNKKPCHFEAQPDSY